jgi:cyclic pyranopterin phosphate synthase
MTTTPTPRLVDRFGRRVTYVRISVTDRCDFRCVYCMEEKMTFLPRAQVLTLEEHARIVRAFAELGVTKVRITGGEPLVRCNILWLFRRIGEIDAVTDLSLTSNGSQLARCAQALRDAGVRRVNISLDSLRPERFRRMTRVGDLDKVLGGIEAARRAGFERIKINSVLLKGRNHDEAAELVRFVVERGMDISFIEEMPLGTNTDHDRAEVFYSSDELRTDLRRDFDLIATTETTGGPSRYYRIAGSDSRIGFISPHSHNFCEACNRVRVTTEGRLLLCLGQEHSMDLRRVLRSHPGEDLEVVKRALLDSMAIKPRGHDFRLDRQPVILRHMNATGG